MKCTSEEEAIIASKNHKLNEIPVYFFESDTTGEKTEEFYTENELINLERYSGLGFKINNNNLQYNVDKLCDDIDKLFKEFLTKEIFLKTISKYLPNFNHLEYGKNLDDKM